jgi:hypothetical protein
MAKLTRTRTARLSLSACAALAVALLAAPAVRADRPTDKDVKDLIERLNHDRDRFEDQLDGKLKRSILRGPGGEVNVERYLDDLQDNVGKLKDRFTPQYAASQEASKVLRQSSDIQRYIAARRVHSLAPSKLGGKMVRNDIEYRLISDQAVRCVAADAQVGKGK